MDEDFETVLLEEALGGLAEQPVLETTAGERDRLHARSLARDPAAGADHHRQRPVEPRSHLAGGRSVRELRADRPHGGPQVDGERLAALDPERIRAAVS